MQSSLDLVNGTSLSAKTFSFIAALGKEIEEALREHT